MTSLEDSRKKIDEIDSKLMELFEARMNTVVDVAKYKKEKGLEIFQADREKVVVEKNVNRLLNKDLDIYAEEFLNDLMKVSRKYQSAMLED